VSSNHFRSFVLFIAFAGCGPSSEQKAEFEALQKALEPHQARAEKMLALLPAPGEEQEIACREPLAEKERTVLTVGQVEEALGRGGERAPKFERWFDTDPAIAMDTFSSSMPTSEVDARAHIGNVSRKIKRLNALRHVVLVRATAVDEGAMAATRNPDGSSQIERPASWKGWMFQFTYADEPELIGAFPVEGRSRDDMTVLVEQGSGAATWHLMQDTILGISQNALARLGRKGCSAS
jgi:hypothetical protein